MLDYLLRNPLPALEGREPADCAAVLNALAAELAGEALHQRAEVFDVVLQVLHDAAGVAMQIKDEMERRLRAHIDALTRDQKREYGIEEDRGPSLGR